MRRLRGRVRFDAFFDSDSAAFLGWSCICMVKEYLYEYDEIVLELIEHLCGGVDAKWKRFLGFDR